jgi:hypothetical protein
MIIMEDCLRLDESMSPLPDIDELKHSFEFRKQANYINLWVTSLESHIEFRFIDLIIFEFKNNNYRQTIDILTDQHKITMNYSLKNNIIDIVNIDNRKGYKIYEIQLTKNAILQLI